MSKFFAVFALVAIAVAAGAPTSPDTAVLRAQPALVHEEVHDQFGQYEFRYVTAEGTIVEERGRLVPNADGSGLVMVTEGQTTYIGDDGKTYITKYSAGLDGTKVEAAHLPVAPELLLVE